VKQQPLNTIATDWTDLVLICRKCSRKLDGGFGADGDETLRRALRGALRRRALRGTIGLVEGDCFGVCPKRAVTVARGSHADEFLIVPENFSADALLDRMLDAKPDTATTTIGDAQP
jgi:predicted metal-binding protein